MHWQAEPGSEMRGWGSGLEGSREPEALARRQSGHLLIEHLLWTRLLGAVDAVTEERRRETPLRAALG